MTQPFLVSKKYPFQVWMASIILSAFAISIFIARENIPVFLFILVATIGYTMVLSIPAFVLYFVSYRLLSGKIKSLLLLKIFTTLAGVAATMTSVYFFISFFNEIKTGVFSLNLPLLYAISVIVASILFEIKGNENI